MLNHVNNGKLSLQQLINLMCENPCKIFGIKNKGYIKEGFDADLTIADMNKEVTIKNEMIVSKCGWTCLLYTSPSPRDRTRSRMTSSA